MEVAVVGTHLAPREPGSTERLEELAFRAASGALADAGITREDIDSLVIATSDELDGRSISSMLMAAPAGGLRKDEIKVQDSGLHGLVLAGMRIASGEFELGMVVSWAQSSQVDVEVIEQNALEPFIARPSGIIEPIAAALTAGAYLEKFGRTVEDLDARAAHKRNQKVATKDEAFLAYPLRRSHFSEPVDGAVALVLASAETAKKRDLKSDVWLTGVGWGIDTYPLSERELASYPVLEQVARRALRSAGLGGEELDYIECDDQNVVYEAMAVEALGLAEPGRGFDVLSGSANNKVNRLTTNAADGLPLFCGGLWRAAEAVAALSERPDATRVLVHDSCGIRAQGHVIAILERR